MVSGGCVCAIWWRYAEVVEVCGSICGHQNKIWRKMGGKWAVERKWCCQGPDIRGAGCPGSESMDGFEDLREARSNPGKIQRNLWMEIGEKWMES